MVQCDIPWDVKCIREGPLHGIPSHLISFHVISSYEAREGTGVHSSFHKYKRPCSKTSHCCYNCWCQHIVTCTGKYHATHCCLPSNIWSILQTLAVSEMHNVVKNKWTHLVTSLSTLCFLLPWLGAILCYLAPLNSVSQKLNLRQLLFNIYCGFLYKKIIFRKACAWSMFLTLQQISTIRFS